MSQAHHTVKVLRSGWFPAFLVGAVIGAAIWAVSPFVVGSVEPWDAESPFYFGSLFVYGVLAWIIFRRKSFGSIAGLYLGQVAYLRIGSSKHPAAPS